MCSDRTINGTSVHECYDGAQGEAVLTNSCGTQRMSAQDLSNGAIPTDIVPCPRSSGGSSHSDSGSNRDFYYQMASSEMNKGSNSFRNKDYLMAEVQYESAEEQYRKLGDGRNADIAARAKRQSQCWAGMSSYNDQPSLLRMLRGERPAFALMPGSESQQGVCREFPDAMNWLNSRINSAAAKDAQQREAQRQSEARQARFSTCKDTYDSIRSDELNDLEHGNTRQILTRLHGVLNGSCSEFAGDTCDGCVGQAIPHEIARLEAIEQKAIAKQVEAKQLQGKVNQALEADPFNDPGLNRAADNNPAAIDPRIVEAMKGPTPKITVVPVRPRTTEASPSTLSGPAPSRMEEPPALPPKPSVLANNDAAPVKNPPSSISHMTPPPLPPKPQPGTLASKETSHMAAPPSLPKKLTSRDEGTATPPPPTVVLKEMQTGSSQPQASGPIVDARSLRAQQGSCSDLTGVGGGPGPTNCSSSGGIPPALQAQIAQARSYSEGANPSYNNLQNAAQQYRQIEAAFRAAGDLANAAIAAEEASTLEELLAGSRSEAPNSCPARGPENYWAGKENEQYCRDANCFERGTAYYGMLCFPDYKQTKSYAERTKICSEKLDSLKRQNLSEIEVEIRMGTGDIHCKKNGTPVRRLVRLHTWGDSASSDEP